MRWPSNERPAGRFATNAEERSTAGGPGSDAFARLYDLDLAEDPGDLDLYLALASRTGGPVLELGAGTGRLAIPIAEAGHSVTAVDRDPAALERARARLATAGTAVARRVSLVEADMTTLRLPNAGDYKFGFIALNSLLLLGQRDRQVAALRVLASHLARGGVAAVDVWIPDAEDLGRFDGRLSLEYARADPLTGRVVTKLSSARHDAASGIVELTVIYDEAAPGEAPARWLRTDRLRLVGADDLVGMAESVGLRVETLAGDHALTPLGVGSERAVLVAVRP
ncbi:MAG TPA: class I SAM-dependent methyltransferase [Candidatus Limnocylindrales bacterium]|nr:class I SAM-dependent methyltransferase [Candidatus Limnocylindrales bacterium]